MQLSKILFGATRRVMTGKHGNKNFYKGRGVRNPGFHTKWGGYKIVQKKVPEFIVPDLSGFEMKPYVSYRTPQVKTPIMTADRLVQEIKNNIDIINYKEIP
ncbi:39S ribosomal protein L41-A, mitochondrial-like [Hydractinia symbiolongicarpus]|uniref:39S ribosomal protein L41-A, mitochondrial-like n=1 Tax=Hydractinia symbiolongicarpus TaxID=13093 RepID=UPI00254A8C64|nr:39S ribosomal protein L41-A, mitochondrial-like [Hydractinia symbiolongicarpus]